MPPLPTINDVLKVQLQWSDGEDPRASSNLFFRYSGGPPSAATCVTLAGDIVTAAEGMDGNWGTATALMGTKVTDLSTDTGGEGEYGADVAGTRSGDPLPGAAALLINYAIARRYRGGRPRNYFPWGTGSDVGNRQTWADGLVGDVNDTFGAFLAGIIGLSVGGTTITDHVNVSYYSGFTVVTNPITHRARNVPTPRATPVVDDILSYNVSAQIASQRRRNRV